MTTGCLIYLVLLSVGGTICSFLSDDVSVNCDEHGMRVFIKKSNISSSDDSSFQFLDVSCQSFSNSTHVIAFSPLDSCGMLRKSSRRNIIYRNMLSQKFDTAKNMDNRCQLADIYVTCKFPVIRANSRFPRSIETVKSKIMIKCKSLIGVGPQKEEGILNKAILGSDKIQTNKKVNSFCPFVIGIGEELEPDRVLTYTKIISPTRIRTKQKIKKCRLTQARGKFALKMSLYTDNSFTTLLPVHKVKQTALFGDIFYEITLRNRVDNLIIKPKFCYATPYPDPAMKQRHVFLKDGCPHDETYQTYPTGMKKSRFSITGFRFVNSASKSFYVHCNVNICDQSNADLCNFKCDSENKEDTEKNLTVERKKRSTVEKTNSVGHKTIVRQVSYIVKSRRFFFFKNYELLTAVLKFHTPKHSLIYGEVPVLTETKMENGNIWMKLTPLSHDKVKIRNCYYGLSRLRRNQKTLIKDGCLSDDTDGLLMWDSYGSNIIEMKLPTLSKSFGEMETAEKFLTCNIDVCDEGDAGCESKCPNDVQNKRSKRDVKLAESKPLPLVTLTCDAGSITVAVKKPLPNNLQVSKLHLLDPKCKATENNTHVILSTKTHACGTRYTQRNTQGEYSNILMEQPPPGMIIIRRDLLEIPIKCVYKVKPVVSRSIRVRYEASAEGISSRAFGSYKVGIVMYEDGSFTAKADTNIVEINSDRNMFFEVKITSSQLNLDLFLDECFGYPASASSTREKYVFIQNGCSRDDSLKFYNSDNGRIKFSLKPFMFNKNDAAVMINCFVTVCNAKEEGSKCRSGCQY